MIDYWMHHTDHTDSLPLQRKMKPADILSAYLTDQFILMATWLLISYKLIHTQVKNKKLRAFITAHSPKKYNSSMKNRHTV